MSEHLTKPGAKRFAGERGSALPLVALAIVTLMTCAALAIDLGSLAASNRRLQGVADLAAIAGSNELIGLACNHKYTLDGEPADSSTFDHVRAAAVENAVKNAFPIGGTKALVVEVGTIAYSGNVPTFTSMWSSATGADCPTAAVPTAVRVSATDFTTYSFGPVVGQGGRTSSRSGTASRSSSATTGVGGFTIGSSVANLDSSSSPVLSSVLNGMVCRGVSGCSFSTTLVGYQGLAAAGVTLGQLQAQLGAGSITSLLSSDIKVRDLYLASAKALGCTVAAGCTNAAAVTLLGLYSSVTASATFKLRDMITVGAGGETAAAATSMNVLGLITGSAQVINGTNTVSIPSLGVTIPGVSSTSLSLKVIEAPRTYIGPAGGPSVSTSQVEATATQQLNLLNIPITGSLLGNLATVTGALPVKVTAGSAKGTLTDVRCGSDKGETVSVDTTGATTAIGDTNVANKFLAVRIAGLSVSTLNVNASNSVGGVSGTLLEFDYPSEYSPATSAPTHVGGTKLNVSSIASVNSTLSAAGLSLNASALTTALVGATGTVTLLDTTVISPVLRALGVTVGGADVWAIGAPGCGAPTLSG